MREADISKALGQYLMGMADAPPIYWENQNVPEGTARPYLSVQMVRVSRRNPDLAGGSAGTIARGYMQITIVSDLDQFATSAEETADAIAAYFVKGTKLEESGGKVTIMEAPSILPALRDGSDWRVPVQIDYWAS
ncbi:MAG: hypothetical protein GOVbin2937_36 [Prokaryotic dsDNA virus sp.]|nr:MAG: hypothetical protein GOVbin2937_36 [Prokaryotic dsDNA virus sp.]|tara:strand:- start:183 stop:587 length:405 start_codon:yes stop_codon:yes gene_type:complete